MNKIWANTRFSSYDFIDAQKLLGNLPELSFYKEQFLDSEEMALV